MEIELRNFNHSELANEETYCFQAHIYVNGKKRGTAKNDGHGGQTYINPNKLRQEIEKYGESNPLADTSDRGYFAEMLIDDLVIDSIISQELERR